jgi:hypothetical protein
MTKKEQAFHKSHHEQEAAAHTEFARCMSKSAASHTALADHLNSTDSTAAQHHRDLAALHKEAAAQHVLTAEHHLECAKAVGQLEGSDVATGSSDVKSLVDRIDKLLGATIPSAASVIPTSFPRHGQPTTQADRDGLDKKIPVELHEVLGPAIR